MQNSLAFSGGLDTSIILKWLQNEKDAEVLHLLLTSVKALR